MGEKVGERRGERGRGKGGKEGEKRGVGSAGDSPPLSTLPYPY